MKIMKNTLLIGMAASLSMIHLACSKKQQVAQQTPPAAPAPPPTIQLKSASNLFEMSLTRLDKGQENPEAGNAARPLHPEKESDRGRTRRPPWLWDK